MPLIHHVVTGSGDPPIVFVHGFACGQSDWAAQTAHLSPRHRIVAVDLRGHGMTPGDAVDCSLERYGADVVEVMRALALPPAVLVGHSMGCRVVLEAALQAPEHTAGVIFADGSQFAPEMAEVMRQRFAAPDGFAAMTGGMFTDMFTAGSDAAVAAAVVARAGRLPPAIGQKMLLDIVRYDVGRLTSALGCLRVPALAIQTTTRGADGVRASLAADQSSPYLDMLRAAVPGVRVEIIESTGHFPQLDAPARTNAAIESFLNAL